MTDGTAQCWGQGANGALGNGSTTGSDLPATVVDTTGSGQLSGVAQLAVGDEEGTDDFSCALLNNGHIACWGINDYGQLAQGTVTGPDVCTYNIGCSLHPILVKDSAGTSTLSGATGVTVGFDFACATLTDTTVRCWGRNDAQTLGDGTNNPSSLPVTVSNSGGTGPLSGVASVAAGLYQTCARNTDGTAECWGANSLGQLGDGTTTNQPRPVTVQNRGIPSPPTITGTTPGNGWISVAWNAPATPGISAIYSYRVTAHAGVNSITTTVPYDAHRTVVFGLTNGTKYDVTVAAINVSGPSAPSAIVQATPAPAPISVTTQWTNAELPRLQAVANYLGTTPAQLQHDSVGMLAYLLSFNPPSHITSMSGQVTSAGPTSVTSTWATSDEAVLANMARQFGLTPAETQKYATQVVEYLLSLGGH